jgi:SAM-dependent methyltransferase
MAINAINQRVFGRARVARSYAGWEQLFPAETRIFEQYAQQFQGDVLDIAIGAGRTTKPLLELACRYVGFDYSPAMIARARQRFPKADLRVADMREVLSSFPTARFDAILIAFNGIDCIEWDDRNRLLRELKTLLRPGGVLVFSSHNLDVADRLGQQFQWIAPELREPGWTHRPLDVMKAPMRATRWIARAVPNRIRNRLLERHFDGYAYLNDSGEAYGLLTCFVSEAKMRAVLDAMDYRTLDVIGGTGEDSEWTYYVCTPREN